MVVVAGSKDLPKPHSTLVFFLVQGSSLYQVSRVSHHLYYYYSIIIIIIIRPIIILNPFIPGKPELLRRAKRRKGKSAMTANPASGMESPLVPSFSDFPPNVKERSK